MLRIRFETHSFLWKTLPSYLYINKPVKVYVKIVNIQYGPKVGKL